MSSTAKEKKIPGIVKFLIFVAIVAALYFFAWPKVKPLFDAKKYDTANDNAKSIYDSVLIYQAARKATQDSVTNVSCEKILAGSGKKSTAQNVVVYVNSAVDGKLDGSYFSIQVDAAGEIKRVFWSETNKGDDIIGAYPDPFDADDPESRVLKNCVKTTN